MPTWNCKQYTDKGYIRSTNEDSILNLYKQNLWAVADGMGGHKAGDYASQHVTMSLSHFQKNNRLAIEMSQIERFLHMSNTHLVNKARNENLGTIGSTVSVLNIFSNRIICTWCGDSRIYRMRNGKISQLTRDHVYRSVVEDRNCLLHPSVNDDNSLQLIAAIGGTEIPYIEHCWFSLQAEDTFLLCTDGLYKHVNDDEIEAIMKDNVQPSKIISTLITLFQQRGARDNIGLLYVYPSS